MVQGSHGGVASSMVAFPRGCFTRQGAVMKCVAYFSILTRHRSLTSVLHLRRSQIGPHAVDTRQTYADAHDHLQNLGSFLVSVAVAIECYVIRRRRVEYFAWAKATVGPGRSRGISPAEACEK